MKKDWNKFLAAIFFILCGVVLIIGTQYKTSKSNAYKHNQYNKLASSLSNKFKTLIEEKKNATLTIGLSLAQNTAFQAMLENQKKLQATLSNFSTQLRAETDFKNVWIQLVDKNGTVLSRSWTEKYGDKIYDEKNLKSIKKIHTSLHVDKYDLSFNASVPIFDTNGVYIGALQTITHFNSIAKKIEGEGFEPLILVDKKYAKQLEHPFTDYFIQEYYIANKDISKELFLYLKSLNIEKEIDYKTNYSIDADRKYFKVYSTIFDEKNRPMVYTIMYKKVKYIETDYIQNTNFIVNIFMIFSIVILAFVFILLVEKHSDTDHNKKTLKYLMLFSVIYIFIAFVYYLLLSWYQSNEKNNYLRAYNNNIEKDYHIIRKKFQAVAETMFETTLKDPRVLELVRQAYTLEKKDTAREKLYLLLQERYEFYKQYDLRQLHFHLKDNESFLRFHRPKKYGDNLTGIRETVEWVNTHHAPISGFEEGRIYNGFRYVFPMTHFNESGMKEHLGSVEVSFSAHAIAHEFAYSDDAAVGFVIHKDVVETKVFHSEKSNYDESELSDFYYETVIKKQFEYDFRHFKIEEIPRADLEFINRKILEGEVFSLAAKDNNTLFTFFPIKNPITKNTVASIIIQAKNQILKKQNDFFLLLLSIGIILIFLIIIFIFREYTLKLKFFDLSIKTQHILDAQSSIVIITNGKKIFDVNKKFLEFFGYATLEEFKKEYDCICEHFVEDESYFHLGKVPENTTWVDFSETILAKDRVVLIRDKDAKEHSLGISVSHYKHEYYLVTFTDVSGTMQEQFRLEKKLIQDLLTGAYNREFFENNVESIIQEGTKRGLFVGLIFFDIDHFKAVNDLHGHNVGDYILKELSHKILSSIRSNDYLIRWGGEEFIILSETKSLEELTRMAEHLRSMISHYQFDEVKTVTCSFGVTLHIGTENIRDTIERVDGAMYTSKHSGRNRVTAV